MLVVAYHWNTQPHIKYVYNSMIVAHRVGRRARVDTSRTVGVEYKNYYLIRSMIAIGVDSRRRIIDITIVVSAQIFEGNSVCIGLFYALVFLLQMCIF